MFTVSTHHTRVPLTWQRCQLPSKRWCGVTCNIGSQPDFLVHTDGEYQRKNKNREAVPRGTAALATVLFIQPSCNKERWYLILPLPILLTNGTSGRFHVRTEYFWLSTYFVSIRRPFHVPSML